MADYPPPFLLPPHVIPTHVLPTHHLWPPTQRHGFRQPGPPHIEENGRLYQSFRKEVYPFPCDEAEKERLELFQKVFLLARNWVMHARPLPHLENGERVRILDLGTGTGAWALRMAVRYPKAEILGLDLANIQPAVVPWNLRFQVPFDYGSHWFNLGAEKPWDLIHLRCALGSVSNWTNLYQNIFRRLKPGGVFEQVEIDLQPRWNNGRPLPRDHPLQRWFDALLYATTQVGRSIGWRQDIEELLLSQGFVDFRTEVIKLPITERPTFHGVKSRTLSAWYTAGLLTSLEALSLRPLTQNLGWPVAGVREFNDGLGRMLEETMDVHLHNNLHIVTARRPHVQD